MNAIRDHGATYTSCCGSVKTLESRTKSTCPAIDSLFTIGRGCRQYMNL